MSTFDELRSPENKNPKEALEHLKQIYHDFAKPVRWSMLTCGCLIILVIIAGIITGVSISWLLGILGGILLVALMVYMENRFEAHHKRHAKERVSAIEKMYGLSHEESFDLLFSTRSGTNASDKNEWKAFVTGVWGEYALRKNQSVASASTATALPEAQAPTAAPICPRCGNTEVTEQTKVKGGKTTSTIIGGALGGIVGAMIVGPFVEAFLSKSVTQYECKSCGHKWEGKAA